MDAQRITLQVAFKLHEIATRQGNVPFLTGDLRKAHVVEPVGTADALVAANTPYARAVHDGRPEITIRSRRKGGLFWEGAAHPMRAVTQPARKPNPWLLRAVEELEREGLGFLADELGEAVADDLTRALRARGLTVRSTRT